ncbi:hypothetical protein [Hydrogenophaga sp. BPS33]|uniref:hypothetical protein n=1 Tax=Hydrogenophaga sp. BPS33 TaxID=2651974 RepID=UPI0013201E00|nr:hypothetical protein [Hydrogenophaga sp. BPS33]QHE86229.1 hypothetical protein F9K07_15615 [Hydrogenophaga sp. BPS33]
MPNHHFVDQTAPAPCATSPLERITRRARVIKPLTYRNSAGRKKIVPIGPCLIEHSPGTHVDIVWGASGQHSAQLPKEAIENAEADGQLVLLE